MSNETLSSVASTTTTYLPLPTGDSHDLSMPTMEAEVHPYEVRCVRVIQLPGLFRYIVDVTVTSDRRTIRGVVDLGNLENGDLLIVRSESLKALEPDGTGTVIDAVIDAVSDWWWQQSGGAISWPTEALN